MWQHERRVTDVQSKALHVVFETAHHSERRPVGTELLESVVAPDDAAWHLPRTPPLKPFFAHRQNPHLDELVQAIDARLRKSLVSVSQ